MTHPAPPAAPTDADVIIVGGGLAGLAAARSASRAGASVQLLEADDAVGGRARSDVVDGFVLDRGFQVLLEAYPTARRILDLPALRLGSFAPGASVWNGSGFVRIGDPFRAPGDLVPTLRSGIGTLGDKLRVLALRRRVHAATDPYELLGSQAGDIERSSAEYLRDARGFSPDFIEQFWKPFYGGIFLEPELASSHRMLEFTFRLFSDGAATIPHGGIGAMATQLAATLPEDVIHTATPVHHASGTDVRLADGSTLRAGAVVVAAGPWASGQLAGIDRDVPDAASTSCLHFAAAASPLRGRRLLLDGTGRGPAGVVCVPSDIASGIAPDGQSLICVNTSGRSTLDDESLQRAVRAQLTTWFGPVVREWRHLRTLHIDRALPDQRPPHLTQREWPLQLGPTLFEAGDHVDTASIDGALRSGERAGIAAAAAAGSVAP